MNRPEILRMKPLITLGITHRITPKTVDFIDLLPLLPMKRPPHIGAQTQAAKTAAHMHNRHTYAGWVIWVIQVISMSYSGFKGNTKGNKPDSCVITSRVAA